MKADWPPLSEYEATSGRLASKEDVQAGRATFLLESDGVRIGRPISMTLPAYAYYREDTDAKPVRCIIIQAEEADGYQYFGAWLIDADSPCAGARSDFEITHPEQ